MLKSVSIATHLFTVQKSFLTLITASEHSTRHYRKPDGTPPPPYSTNGANRRIDPPHKVKDSQLDSRGDPDRRDDVLIQNGYLTSGGGLFGGRQQSDSNQVTTKFLSILLNSKSIII